MKKLIFSLSFLTVMSFVAQAQTLIAAKDAGKHIGETVTITAKIFGSKSFASKMILLDVGGNNPNQELTLIIPASAKEKFKGDPEADYKGKDITVTGKLEEFKGKPQIALNDPKQIKLVLTDNTVPVIARFN